MYLNTLMARTGAIHYQQVPQWWSFAVKGTNLAGATVLIDGVPANSVQSINEVCRGNGVGGSSAFDMYVERERESSDVCVLMYSSICCVCCCCRYWIKFRVPGYSSGWSASPATGYRVDVTATDSTTWSYCVKV